MEKLTLRTILLTKLHHVLNPVLNTVVIRTTLAGGIACFGYAGLSSSLASVHYDSPWGAVVLSFGNDNAVPFSLFGIGLVFVAVTLHIKNSLRATPAANTDAQIHDLLRNLTNDMENDNFLSEHKRLIFKNRHREILAIFEKHYPGRQLTIKNFQPIDCVGAEAFHAYKQHVVSLIGEEPGTHGK